MVDAFVKALLALAMLIFAVPSAFAQAGATGGVIGKTDKSLSGEGRSPEPEAAKPAAKGQRSSEPKPSEKSSGVSIAGRWRWSATCSGIPWKGAFDISQGAGGSFSGSFAGTSAHDIGTISDGRISGSSFSFTRTNAVVTQHWSGRLSGGRMSGTSTGNANCNWQASR